MTTSQSSVSNTEAMLTAERDHSSLLESPNASDTLSNGLLLQSSGPKQNGHLINSSTDNTDVHHSNGHSTANGNILSEVYVYIIYLFSMPWSINKHNL